ncbi:uncharacterized protein RCC_03364 [Ramularia collo-cygni]|uniref:FHA domain-containing protein n=1 Tax=Ramularia collo-cygni TaxID=112498 RepID=A0A2D3UWL9_9PEZI|nr:uncharacterized protein RCC_03364 [Ramularia collo-cygni]CZT17530.1 uncharacterized protein RCC_03364 [Ramularia collo-cygni]
MPFGFNMLPDFAVEPTVMRIALTSNLTNDRREFNIHADGEPITIGRASRTRGKQLEAQNDNALFDCPVVSRIHAELRASTKQPFAQEVTIADLSSLHGTKVNGLPLLPDSRFVLRTGDVIKLGERVTRGNGVSVTFERLPRQNSMSSMATFEPTTTIRGFRAPSLSDGSDLDSDHAASFVSDGQYHPSSAKTTPEQNKMKLGTQNVPIAVDDDSHGFEEDIVHSLRDSESYDRPAFNSNQPTDFDSFSDAGSVQDARYVDNTYLIDDGGSQGAESEDDSDIDHIDEVEYGEDEEDDNLSQSASDLSSDEASDVENERDEEDARFGEPAYRELSPELGTFDDTTDVTSTLADIPGMKQSRWDIPSSKQYDPAHSSLAAVKQTSEPSHQSGRITTSFTGHWDVQHPIIAKFPKSTLPTLEQGVIQPPTLSQALFPMSIDAIVDKTIVEGSTTVEETINKEITGIESFSKEIAPATGTDGITKRKRDEVDDAADVLCPPAKKAVQAPPAPPARRRLAPKKQRSIIREAVVSATQAAAFAAVGAVGTVAFLSSPMAESLIQWLG